MTKFNDFFFLALYRNPGVGGTWGWEWGRGVGREDGDVTWKAKGQHTFDIAGSVADIPTGIDSVTVKCCWRTEGTTRAEVSVACEE